MELTLPSGPFTADQAHALGLPRVVLHTAVAEGLIVRPMRGVYLAAHVEMTEGVRAAAARLPPGHPTRRGRRRDA
jgi:hypothetical protein